KGEAQNRCFSIGFDCLEKLLRNNAIICNFDENQIKDYKRQIGVIIRFCKQLNEDLKNNPQITGLYFEPQSYKSDYFTYYYLTNNNPPKVGRMHNTYLKAKGIEYEFIHKTVANILSDKTIIYYGNY